MSFGLRLWVIQGFTTIFFAMLLLAVSRLKPRVQFRWSTVWKLNLSLVFVMVGILGHLMYPERSAELMPDFLPYRIALSYITGVLELVMVAGLWSRYQRQTALAIIAYLVAIIPFNIYGWTIAENTPNYIDQPYYLYYRVPLQALFIAFAHYGTRD